MVYVKQTSSELDKLTTYLLTESPDMTSIKNVEDGTSIPVDSWLIFEYENKDGDTVEILSIISEGEVFATQSNTFKTAFLRITEIMEDQPFAVFKRSGTTNSGRPYVNCVLDVEYVRAHMK